MSTHYVAVVEKEPDSAFGVWFPDVEGCFSAGETLEAAVANAAMALRQKARERAQDPRLAGMRRTQDREELSVADVQRHVDEMRRRPGVRGERLEANVDEGPARGAAGQGRLPPVGGPSRSSIAGSASSSTSPTT